MMTEIVLVLMAIEMLLVALTIHRIIRRIWKLEERMTSAEIGRDTFETHIGWDVSDLYSVLQYNGLTFPEGVFEEVEDCDDGTSESGVR